MFGRGTNSGLGTATTAGVAPHRRVRITTAAREGLASHGMSPQRARLSPVRDAIGGEGLTSQSHTAGPLSSRCYHRCAVAALTVAAVDPQESGRGCQRGRLRARGRPSAFRLHGNGAEQRSSYKKGTGNRPQRCAPGPKPQRFPGPKQLPRGPSAPKAAAPKATAAEPQKTTAPAPNSTMAVAGATCPQRSAACPGRAAAAGMACGRAGLAHPGRRG